MFINESEKASEYDQIMPQSQITDQSMAPRGRDHIFISVGHIKTLLIMGQHIFGLKLSSFLTCTMFNLSGSVKSKSFSKIYIMVNIMFSHLDNSHTKVHSPPFR